MSFPVQKSGMEKAVKFPSSSQRARALSTDSGIPEKLQSPVTDSGNDISEHSCTHLGATSTQEWVERKVGLQKQKTQEKKEAESRGPIEKEEARAGLSKEKEAKGMTDGERAAKAAEEKLGKHSHCQTGGEPVGEHNYWLGSYRFTGTQLCYTNGSEEAQV